MNLAQLLFRFAVLIHPLRGRSFRKRCDEVFAGLPIWIAHPEGLDLRSYMELIPGAIGVAVLADCMESKDLILACCYNQPFMHSLFFFSTRALIQLCGCEWHAEWCM